MNELYKVTVNTRRQTACDTRINHKENSALVIELIA